MKICITLDDVIRAKTKQFGEICKKAGLCEDLSKIDLSTNNFQKAFGFETKEDYNRFLYEDYPFEIFGEAPVMTKMLDKNLNLWLLDLSKNNKDVSVSFSNPFEFNTSIGFTHFFLSQIATRVRETFFPVDSMEIWDRCDVLVTADPKLLSKKPGKHKLLSKLIGKTPKKKISVKIKTDYNEKVKADYEYDSLMDFINDKEIIRKIKKDLK